MTEWKPEKNTSSPWDVNVWENNIGQPVLDTYSASIQNNTYIQPQGTLKIGPSGYKLDPKKLAKAPQYITPYLFLGAFYYNEEESVDDIISDQINILKERGFIEKDHVVINTGSTPVDQHLPTNMIKVTKVD